MASPINHQIDLQAHPGNSTRCTVMGLGRFGGGLGVTRWLLDRGCRVLLTDLASRADLAESLESLHASGRTDQLDVRLGGHASSDFTNCDLVIANPAVPHPWDHPLLNAARAAGVPVTTEIQLLCARLDRQRVIGITGTNGKSTTAAMIHHILVKQGRDARLGGNIGGSLLQELDTITADTWIVLEVSSAMLYWLNLSGPGRWSPATAVITNVAANHLDWHGTQAHYRQCKETIAATIRGDDIRIRGDQLAAPTTPLPMRLPGRHNQINANVAILTAAQAAGIDPGEAARALRDFPGLPHRLEALTLPGSARQVFNDSKSTTPQATLLAVEAMGSDVNRVHLIAGGYDKGISLQAIAELRPHLGGLYPIGATGQKLAAAADVMACGTLDTAVQTAWNCMGPDDVLLLSPGCASWDQFKHFEIRGDRFKELVISLAAQEGTIGSS